MDNLLLLLFALPIATIILASVLETLLNCPIKVASIFFAIFLVITFTFFDATFLIFAIIYTLIAFFAAWLYENFIRNASPLNVCEIENNCRRYRN